MDIFLLVFLKLTSRLLQVPPSWVQGDWTYILTPSPVSPPSSASFLHTKQLREELDLLSFTVLNLINWLSFSAKPKSSIRCPPSDLLCCLFLVLVQLFLLITAFVSMLYVIRMIYIHAKLKSGKVQAAEKL